MTELHVFESPDFRAVRTTEIDGKPYFCGADAANALWYAKPIRAFVNEDGKVVCLLKDVNNQSSHEVTLIDENGNLQSKVFDKTDYGKFLREPIIGNIWKFYDEAQTKEAPTKVESVNIESTAVNDSNIKTGKALIEKLNNAMPEIRDMQAVAKLTGHEFPKGKIDIVTQVGNYFKSLGNKVTRKGFGDIIIDSNTVKDDMAHGIGRAKSVTFKAVPAVLENGIQIDYQKDWKGRGKDSYVFAAPIDIGGEKAYVCAVVLKGKDKRFYLHEVVNDKGERIYLANKKEPDAFKTGDSQQSGISRASNSSVQIVPHPATESQEKKDRNKFADIVGLDKVGSKVVIDTNAVNHIDNRHGVNGQQDHSMSNIEDIARIKYVLDNYDEAIYNGDKSKGYVVSNGKPAPNLILSKKVDNHYYVIEAMCDGKSDKNYIVSAFINKNKIEPQQSSMAKSAQGTNGRDTAKPLVTDSSINNNVPHPTPESQEKRVENSEINVSERENEVEKLKKLESEESIQADIERIDTENKNLEKELESSTDEPDTDESIIVPTTTRAARYEIDEKTAKTARDMRSMRGYKAGEATRENQRDLRQFRTAGYLNFQTGVRQNYTVWRPILWQKEMQIWIELGKIDSTHS